jgi:hypothetical protein
MFRCKARRIPWKRPLLLAVLVLVGSANVAVAGTCPPGGTDPQYCTRIPTSLSASPVVPGGVSAKLTRTDTGAPLPGQTLTFTAGATTLCVATTDSLGRASCTSLTAVLTALLNLGYTVNFAGTTVYLPSSAQGSAIGLASVLVGSGTGLAHDVADRRAWLRARLHAIGRARLVHELQVLRARDAKKHGKHPKVTHSHR